MIGSIQRLSPHAQCCFSYESKLELLDKVCHHCGQAISTPHPSTPIYAQRFMINPEYTNLGLRGEENQNAIHCPGCAHNSHDRRKFWRIVGALLGSDWIQKRLYLGKDRPPLPTVPNVNGIAIADKISGKITIDPAGKYSEEAALPTGELKIALQFLERDRTVAQTYCQKYGLAWNDATLSFHSGFAAVHNSANVCFDLPATGSFAKVGVFGLTDKLGIVDFLLEQSLANPPKSAWDAKFPYTIVRGDQKPIPLPIRLVPAIVPDDTGRSLELTIQVNLDLGTSPDVELIRIDDLTVQAPQIIEPVSGAKPFPRINTIQVNPTPPPQIEVHWQGVHDLAKDKPQSSVFIRYAKPLRAEMIVKGKLKIVFNGALSGLKEVRLYYPWGETRNDKPANARRQTTVEVDFELHLDHLRFQDLHIAPPWHKEWSPARDLDHYLIDELTRCLDDTGIYVKKIVENPAQTNRNNADLANRFWDIGGRRYVGAHPVDFHLTLTGEQQVGPVRQNPPPIFTPQPSSAPARSNFANKIKADLTVQGVGKEPAMKTLVDELRVDIIACLEAHLP